MPNGEQTHEEGTEQERLQSAIDKNVQMITRARAVGLDFAADNLDHFMNGKGEPRTLPSTLLRRFDEIIEAEDRLKAHVMNDNLPKWVYEVPDRGTIERNDKWVKSIYATDYTSDLAYASGASKLDGYVKMKLRRNGNFVTVSGDYAINWLDRYHWTKGKKFYIPTIGEVYDEDELLLEKYKGAKPFDMNSTWKLTFKGVYDLGEGKWANQGWSLAK